MVDGAIPEKEHTMCDADGLLFRPWNNISVAAMAVVDPTKAPLDLQLWYNSTHFPVLTGDCGCRFCVRLCSGGY
jgi:hypothetical protein